MTPTPTDEMDTKQPQNEDESSTRLLSWWKQMSKTVWWEETKRLTVLSIPTIVIQAGLFFPQFLTASYVGRTLGVQNLDGFTLGNLTSNLMTLSILQGLFTANDTLNPQAFGAGNYREVGLLAMRGFVVCTLAIVPTNVVLFFAMDRLLVALHQNPLTSALATRYYRILMLGLPFYILYAMQWKFLAAQEIMKPLLIVTVVTCALMPLFLQWCVTSFGFVGAPLSLVLYLAAQALLVLLYLVVLQPHHAATWPGLKIREALEWKSVKPYLVLAAGGLLAACEWWFWEIFSLMIGSFGVIPLSIHTIPTQLLTMIVMVPLGVGLALSVRIGATISHDVQRAKDLTFWSCVFIAILVLFMTLGLWVFRVPLIGMFTNDPIVVDVSCCCCVCVVCCMCAALLSATNSLFLCVWCVCHTTAGCIEIVVASVFVSHVGIGVLVFGTSHFGFGYAMDSGNHQHGHAVDPNDTCRGVLCHCSGGRTLCGLGLSLATLHCHACRIGIQGGGV